jgi:hypothetical protein
VRLRVAGHGRGRRRREEAPGRAEELGTGAAGWGRTSSLGRHASEAGEDAGAAALELGLWLDAGWHGICRSGGCVMRWRCTVTWSAYLLALP